MWRTSPADRFGGMHPILLRGGPGALFFGAPAPARGGARPPDGAHAHPHRRRDRRIGPARAAFGLVGLEQDPRVGQIAGAGLAARDHAPELAPLLHRERDPVPLRHRPAPSLLRSSGTAVETARQTKADGVLARIN